MVSITGLGMLLFWCAVSIGAVVTAVMIPLLRKMNMQRAVGDDRKTTLYGTEATEFNKIRAQEEGGGLKREPVPRLGGLTLLPTVFLLGVSAALYTGSSLLLLCVLSVCAVALLMIYDDCTDIGIMAGPPLRLRHRLPLLAGIGLICGFGLYNLLPSYVSLLPFTPLEGIYIGWGIIPLFAAWYIFWQVSSVIDGIDGLSGSIFLILFSGTAILSFIQGNNEAFLLSLLGAGILIPWLYINYAPAKAYLTETGITILIFLFAVITFLLGTGENPGDGLWVGCMFGAILIITWCSNVLQLIYRKKTGEKLFRIAPIHHHFEAKGMPGPVVVLRYMLFTFLCVIAGLSLVLFVS